MNWMLKTLAMAARARELIGRVTRDARREKAQRSDYYGDLWRRAAGRIGARVEDAEGDLLVITRGSQVARVFRNYTDLDGPVMLRMAGNKPLVHRTLRSRGIPVPEFVEFSLATLSVAADFLRDHPTCVVKPASGTGAGAGVTTGVRSVRQLRAAAVRAAGSCSQLLIENQVAGRNVRLLFLDGRLLDAVERRPPTVVGDGRSTIGQLVDRANRTRRERGADAAQVILRYDLDMKRTLSQQQLAWRKTPAAGQQVQLKTVVNDNAAEDNVSVVDALDETLVRTGRAAASALGVRLAGVDVVTTDLTRDLRDSGGVVLEVNTAPGLYIHHSEETAGVAVPILEACLGHHDSREDVSCPIRAEAERKATEAVAGNKLT